MSSILSFDEIKRRYLRVFLALLALTVLTVTATSLHVGVMATIVVGVLIAVAKAGLVASIFMHLKFDNKRLRYFVFVPLLFFLILVLVLTQLGL